MRPLLWNANSVLAVTFCLNTAYFLGSAAAISSAAGAGRWGMNYVDEPFPKTLKIHNRTIHCLGKPQASHYPVPMYTCADISIDGVKLFHAQTKTKQVTPTCKTCVSCGTDDGILNDVHALCREMLHTINVMEPLQAAYILDPTCASKEKEDRVKFFIDENDNAQWLDLKVTNGHIRTLRCSTEEKKT